MRIAFLWIALMASLLAASASTAGDNAVAPKQLQFNLRVYEGDPLGSIDAGTLKQHCDTRLVTLENRPATLVAGGELPVTHDGTSVEHIPFGRTAELRPGKVHDGKVHLDIQLTNTTVAANTKEQTELRTESARTLRTVKFGETVKLRWPGASAGKQVWVEFSVDAIEPTSR
jgi:hypothetical protein